MIENSKSGTQPTGSEESKDQDAFLAALPFIVQLCPDLNPDSIDEFLQILTQNEEAIKVGFSLKSKLKSSLTNDLSK